MKRIHHHRKKILLISLACVVLFAGVVLWRTSPTSAPGEQVYELASESEQPQEDPKEEIEAIDMQPMLNRWQAARGGSAGVVIIDLAAKQTVGEINPHQTFFAASIYKLYVAYIGYQKIADGTYDLDDPYLSGWTRGKCLDEMLRSSHSPCAEKMRLELGIAYLDEQLKNLGLTDTSMGGITTSAADAAIILERLFERRDLTEGHTKLMLESLKEQIYRDALPAGLPSATVYNKVGFRELVEYHDVAIVTLKSGRSFVVSALTQNIGTRGLKALGADLQTTAQSSP